MSSAQYSAKEMLPGVFHIFDSLGVHLTLLVGEKRALLFDAGYGAHDLPAFIRTLTSLPYEVVLSHVHHDHALGAIHFERVYLHRNDWDLLPTYTGAFQRQRVVERAGLTAAHNEAFLNAPFPAVEDMPETAFDLGGMTAQPLFAPGHTPGSVALLVKERGLLLLGDCWNPQTWVFFPEALPVRQYAKTFHSLMSKPFTHALAPHTDTLLTRDFLLKYDKGLNEKGFASAKPFIIAGQEHLPTLAYEPTPGSLLVFRQP